jgi:uroporphyrinogen-III synthase
VIGASTADILVRSHIHVDLEIDRLSSENVFAALEVFAGDLSGLTLLLPSAGLIRELFEQQLAEAGARADNVAAYRTTSDHQRLAQLLALLLGGGIDGVIFTNSTSLDEFRRLVDTDDLTQVLAGVAVVCGDAETARAAHDFGLTAARLMPEPLTADALSMLINARP